MAINSAIPGLVEPNEKLRFLVLMCLTMRLTGCHYGQCMNGPCSIEHERMIKAIKSYGQYWTKPTMIRPCG